MLVSLRLQNFALIESLELNFEDGLTVLTGETGAGNASVRAGADACERVGDGLVAAHIIARPHVEVEPVLKPTKAVRL